MWAALMNDPNMGASLEWRPGSSGPWRPVRGLLRTPSDLVGGLGGLGSRSTSPEAVIRLADVAPDVPRRSDQLRRAGASLIWKIEDVNPDDLGTSYRITLSTGA